MNINRRHTLSDVLGTLGYLALLLQWAWALILLLPPLLKTDGVQTFIMPDSTPTVAHHTTAIALSPILTFAVVMIAFAIVLVGIYFAIKSPAYAVKKVDKSARKAASTIAHHTARRPENVHETRVLSERVLWMIKFGAVLIGLILTFVGILVTAGLSPDIILTIGGYLAIWPIVWFGSQYLLLPRR